MTTEVQQHTAGHGSLKSYIVGFILSLVLTLASFIMIQIHITSYHETIPHEVLIPVIMILAVTQLIVQLQFFLHLSQESRPRWNLIFFVSTVGVVLLVMIGSLWIMSNLNYRMTPEQMNQYIMNQDGL